ncbi:hypothetical protein [Chitinophaga qingshengii]|uniref:DUF928 domain-containing protein n=1 Tax=Chitinophaga qingshengii TaxID=1569794 RepID=A0ABR7THS6_9BACT|nr:hypothetical protein [Chitinophaga qingshengii]MBC9929535.1 hypothetical protein [Chitinophaga qingshengii]
MKRSLFLLLAIGLSWRVAAQVSMTIQLPPAGVMLKAQLWNIVVVSASNAPLNIRITMRLTDPQTNQPLLTGITRTIPLNKGARQLQLQDFMPVQYEYLSAAIDRSANGFLPAGNYMACYSMVVEGDKSGNQPGEDCIPFTIEPVSPPLLNMPANSSELDTRLPQFSWIPPAPLNLFNDLNYDLTLAEVYANQSPEEAIQQNIPVYRAPGLRNIFANYPSGAVQLDTGRQYAWSVTARNGRLFAAQTEVWTFRVKSLPQPGQEPADAYVELKKELDGAVVRTGRILHVSYTNEAVDSTLRYEIIPLETGQRPVDEGLLKIIRGHNRFDVPLERSGLSSGRSYLFRLLNSRGEYWQLKFIYNKGN